MRPEYIPVGQIVNAHGIRGEVKVNPSQGFDPNFIAKFKTVYIDGKAVKVATSRVHKYTVLMKFPGVEDMDAALTYKGKTVSVRRADAPMKEGEYFDLELEGLQVEDCATGETIGTLTRVMTYPAHKVYEVKGEQEYLIPAVPGVFIESVNLDAGVMRVHMMKGLATNEN